MKISLEDGNHALTLHMSTFDVESEEVTLFLGGRQSIGHQLVCVQCVYMCNCFV